MRKIVLTKKTGFKNNTPYHPVVIRDFRGVLFYETESILPVNQFNLPEGEYFIDSGNISPLPKPVDFKLISLPKRERSYPKPYKFKIVYGNNPNKCSIIWEKKIILFDHSFKDKPLFVVDFVRGHEFGHQYYKTEKYCDLWSANFMIRKGYNPSQIGAAPITTLNGVASYDRKSLMVKKLIQNAN